MVTATWRPALFVIAHSPVTSNGGLPCYCRKEMTECEDVSGRGTRTTLCGRYLQECGTCKLSALKGTSFTPPAKSKLLEVLSEAGEKEEHWIAWWCSCTLTSRVRKRSVLGWFALHHNSAFHACSISPQSFVLHLLLLYFTCIASFLNIFFSHFHKTASQKPRIANERAKGGNVKRKLEKETLTQKSVTPDCWSVKPYSMQEDSSDNQNQVCWNDDHCERFVN